MKNITETEISETEIFAAKQAFLNRIDALKEKVSGLSADTSKQWQDDLDKIKEMVHPNKYSDKRLLRGSPLARALDEAETKLQDIGQEIYQALAIKYKDQESSALHEKIEDQYQQDYLAPEKQELHRNKKEFYREVNRLKDKIADCPPTIVFLYDIQSVQCSAFGKDCTSDNLSKLKKALKGIEQKIDKEIAKQTGKDAERAGRKKQYALSAVAAISSGVGVWYGAEKLYQVSAVTSIAAASLVGIAVGFAAYKMCSKKDVEKDIGVELQEQKDQSSELRLAD